MLEEKTKEIATLDEVLFRMETIDKSLLSGDIFDAMRDAILLHPLDEVRSQYKETAPDERCYLLLKTYERFLRKKDKENPVNITYMNFAYEIACNPPDGRHYRTWKPVLDSYQEENNLPVAEWFKKEGELQNGRRN